MQIKTLVTSLRLLRLQKNWSQAEVADRINLSIPAYSKIETGITVISLSRLQQISALYSLTAIQLLTFDETEQQTPQDTDLHILTKKLRDRENEVIDLQKKVIVLYEKVLELNL